MDKIFCYNCFHEKSDIEAECPNCGYSPGQDKDKYPLALPQGTILNGRYIIGRVLGQGGFGITYVAQDWKTKQLVAVKEYLPDSISTRMGSHTVMAHSGEQGESFRYGKECFLNEAKTLAEFIGNPNVVQVYSYFEENGTAYFAMDYVSGISFQTYIQNQGGRIDWQKAEEILFPVMDALELIHSRGVIHRDVTPDNIYITEEGTVKLLDFGAARYSMGDRSRSLDIVLKHGFAPKEQYTRHGRQGAYTDVYSVAASFYYAITGRKPPDSIDRMEEDDLVPPDSLGINIPVYVEQALFKGLAVQPIDRFQSMGQFKLALSGEMQNQTSGGGYAPQGHPFIPPLQIDFTKQGMPQSQPGAVPPAGVMPQSQTGAVPPAGVMPQGQPEAVSAGTEAVPSSKPKIWKQKWFVPVVSGAAALLVVIGVAAAMLGGKGREAKEDEQFSQASSNQVTDERAFINLDNISRAEEKKEAPVQITDSYEDLHNVFASHLTEESELFFIYDDFDYDGTYEAFGITGTPTAPNLYNDVNIYFIKSDGNMESIRPEENFYGYTSDIPMDTGKEKFLVWELGDGVSNSISYIFGVRDGKPYESDISQECSEFGWFGDSLYSALVYWDGWDSDEYVRVYYVYDAAIGDFVPDGYTDFDEESKDSKTVRYYHGVEFYDDFVLEDSGERYYDKYELRNLNYEQLKIARNEIYARHGRKFQDVELQMFFDACSWYDGTIEPEDFNQEEIFNDFEKANIIVIKECETELEN